MSRGVNNRYPQRHHRGGQEVPAGQGSQSILLVGERGMIRKDNRPRFRMDSLTASG